MRIYDPRLGKFLSVDPLTDSYPFYTPYQFAGNSPIANVDLDGAEPKPSITGNEKEGDSKQTSQVNYDYDGTPRTATATWYWHAGGLGTGIKKQNSDGNQSEITTQSGWYTSNQYVSLLAGTTAAKELASESNYYSYGIGSTSSRSELQKFVGNGLSENTANHLSAAAWKTASDHNTYTSGVIYPSSFNAEDILALGIVAKQIIKAVSTKSFFSAQSIDDIIRLKAGGEPWPISPTRAHLGSGLYAWGSKAEANAYLKAITSDAIDFKIQVVEFSMRRTDLKKLKSFIKPKDDKLANDFLGKYSSLFGEGVKHDYQYIQRSTIFGAEHYFRADVFRMFKIK